MLGTEPVGQEVSELRIHYGPGIVSISTNEAIPLGASVAIKSCALLLLGVQLFPTLISLRQITFSNRQLRQYFRHLAGVLFVKVG